MRWLYNILLVITGVPFVGTTFTLIAFLFTNLKDDFKWQDHVYIFAIWLFNLFLLSFIYIKRTKWLENVGIFKSWSNLNVYWIERHGYPPCSIEEKEEFLSWANLTEERPQKYWEIARELYEKINKETKRELSEEKRKSFIKCLAWYMSGLPIHYGEDDHL